jgi:hypothetical protein
MTAEAAGCFKRVTTYYGHDNYDGTGSCIMIISPQPPIVVIGQRIRECNGYIWTWGTTSCPDYDTEFEECPPCEEPQPVNTDVGAETKNLAAACNGANQ